MRARSAWSVIVFLGYCACTFLLFGRSLPYEFVYDDYWRIFYNPSVQQLHPVVDYIADPTTQSGRSLEGHTYRPLSTFVHAMTNAMGGHTASSLRLENLLTHSFNAWLVFLIAIHLLGMSSAAAWFGGALFLLHPLQVETVVWVSELSNILGLTWILLGLLSWERYRRTGRTAGVGLTIISALLGFLTRENSVCLVALLALWEISFPLPEQRKKHWILLTVIAGLTAVYVVTRSYLLHRVAQGPMWGSNVSVHFANVIQTWPIYWQRLLWPDHLRIIYMSLPITKSLAEWRVLSGVVAMACFLMLMGFSWKRYRHLFFCLGAFLIFWLPGSNVIPLNTLFAERLMYPMLASVGWMLGLALQRSNRRRTLILAAVVLLVYTNISRLQIPVWQNEATLWSHALTIESESWFAWGCLGNANESVAATQTNSANKQESLRRALECYRHALKLNPPVEKQSPIKGRIEAVETELQSENTDLP